MKRILLLEDHDDIRRGLVSYLTSYGYEVFAFGTTEAASQGLDEAGPDIAILDVRLPGRSGDDFALELVQRQPLTKVVFATGEPDVHRLQAVIPGARVLQKPIDLDSLAHLLAALDRSA